MIHASEPDAPFCTRELSSFLPRPAAFARNLAQEIMSDEIAFAISENAVSIIDIVKGPVPAHATMCQYRYPSPNGQSGFPKTRLPDLLPATLRQVSDRKRLFADRKISQEPFLLLRVSVTTRINRGETERCAEQKSLQLQPLRLAVSLPVATRSVSRHLLAARPVSAQRLSRAATPALARSSVQRPTSHTASRIPARAGASTDLTFTRRSIPTRLKLMKPRSSTAAAGFLRAQLSRTIRGQEPGRD